MSNGKTQSSDYRTLSTHESIPNQLPTSFTPSLIHQFISAGFASFIFVTSTLSHYGDIPASPWLPPIALASTTLTNAFFIYAANGNTDYSDNPTALLTFFYGSSANLPLIAQALKQYQSQEIMLWRMILCIVSFTLLSKTYGQDAAVMTLNMLDERYYRRWNIMSNRQIYRLIDRLEKLSVSEQINILSHVNPNQTPGQETDSLHRLRDLLNHHSDNRSSSPLRFMSATIVAGALTLFCGVLVISQAQEAIDLSKNIFLDISLYFTIAVVLSLMAGKNILDIFKRLNTSNSGSLSAFIAEYSCLSQCILLTALICSLTSFGSVLSIFNDADADAKPDYSTLKKALLSPLLSLDHYTFKDASEYSLCVGVDIFNGFYAVLALSSMLPKRQPTTNLIPHTDIERDLTGLEDSDHTIRAALTQSPGMLEPSKTPLPKNDITSESITQNHDNFPLIEGLKKQLTESNKHAHFARLFDRLMFPTTSIQAISPSCN